MGSTGNENKVVELKGLANAPFSLKQERRRIVDETFKPGVGCVDRRAHDVNANQIFKWRRQ